MHLSIVALVATCLATLAPSTAPAADVTTTAPAAPSESQNWTDCESPDVALERIIAACNALLELSGLAPDQLATAYYYRGQAYLTQEAWQLAVADYDQVVRLIPQEANAWYLRGRAHSGLEDWTRAIPDYGRAIRLDRENADYFHARGEARRMNGDAEGAIADYGRSIAIDPDAAGSWASRGVAWAELGHGTRRSATTTRRSAAIRNSPSPSPVAAMPGCSCAATRRRCPISTGRSRSSPRSPPATRIAA